MDFVGNLDNVAMTMNNIDLEDDLYRMCRIIRFRLLSEKTIITPFPGNGFFFFSVVHRQQGLGGEMAPGRISSSRAHSDNNLSLELWRQKSYTANSGLSTMAIELDKSVATWLQ